MTRAALTLRAAPTLALVLCATGAAATAAYRAGPPPGHTGAFGEPDCASCHFDAIEDDERGGVVIRAPGMYEAGRTYSITIELRHPELEAGGFQLTARFADAAGARETGVEKELRKDGGNAGGNAGENTGENGGRQAGTLKAGGATTRVLGGRGIEYASHTAESVVASERGVMTWELQWTAPAAAAAVALDVAAQMANDDDSEFGERLYRARHLVRAAPGSQGGR